MKTNSRSFSIRLIVWIWLYIILMQDDTKRKFFNLLCLPLFVLRSTSTSNVSSLTPMGPLTSWRSSERVLNDCSVKKRAASAGGLSNRNTDGKIEYTCLLWLDLFEFGFCK